MPTTMTVARGWDTWFRAEKCLAESHWHFVTAPAHYTPVMRQRLARQFERTYLRLTR